MSNVFLILLFCFVIGALFGLSWLLVEGGSRIEHRMRQRSLDQTMRRLSQQASTRYYL